MFVFFSCNVYGLPNIEKQLTGAKLSDTLSELMGRFSNVQFPQFLMDQRISLKTILQKLGMLNVFDKTAADLSAIGSPGPLFAIDVTHEVFVSVSKSGTETTAATCIEIETLSIPLHVNPPTPFIVDRPFLIVIFEEVTKTVLSIGSFARKPIPNENIELKTCLLSFLAFLFNHILICIYFKRLFTE